MSEALGDSFDMVIDGISALKFKMEHEGQEPSFHQAEVVYTIE